MFVFVYSLYHLNFFHLSSGSHFNNTRDTQEHFLFTKMLVLHPGLFTGLTVKIASLRAAASQDVQQVTGAAFSISSLGFCSCNEMSSRYRNINGVLKYLFKHVFYHHLQCKSKSKLTALKDALTFFTSSSSAMEVSTNGGNES